MIPADTAELADRLAEAVDVFKRLPGLPKPGGYVVNWPEFVRSWEDHDWTVESWPGRPSPLEIDAAEEAMGWFVLLPLKDEQRLLFNRANGKSFCMMEGKKVGRRKIGPRWKFYTDRPARTYCRGHLGEKHRRTLAKLLRILRNRPKKIVDKKSVGADILARINATTRRAA